MSRLLSYLVVVAVVCLVSVGSLAAQEADAKKKDRSKGAREGMQERFKKLDTDGDGSLSLEEFTAGKKRPEAAKLAEAVFKAKDTDGDKKLTPKELRVVSFEEVLVRFDKNKDKKVTAEEFKAGQRKPRDPEKAKEAEKKAEEQFARRDTNGDGVLTAEDFQAKKKRGRRAGKKKKEA